MKQIVYSSVGGDLAEFYQDQELLLHSDIYLETSPSLSLVHSESEELLTPALLWIGGFHAKKESIRGAITYYRSLLYMEAAPKRTFTCREAEATYLYAQAQNVGGCFFMASEQHHDPNQ